MLTLSLKISVISTLISLPSLATASNQHALHYTELIPNTTLSAINGDVSCKNNSGEETTTSLTLNNSIDDYQVEFKDAKYLIHTLELPDGKNQICELKIWEIKIKNLETSIENSYNPKRNYPFLIKINSEDPILLIEEENVTIFETNSSTKGKQKISISAYNVIDNKENKIPAYSPPHIGINYENLIE